MEALAKSLYSATSSAVDQFIDRLVTEFKIDKTKAIAIWNSAGGELKIIEDAPKTAKKAAKKVPAKAPKSESSDCKKCQYVFSKGLKEGETCTSKVADESTTGLYCKRHLDKEKSGDKKDVKKPAAKKGAPSAKKKAEDKEAKSTAVANLKDSAPGFKVNINKWKNYEHEGTGFVFDRKSEEVIGKQNPDGSITPLTLEDIQVCRGMGVSYKLPPNMSSKDDKEDDGEDDEEEEEEEDEEEEDDEDDD